MTRPRFTSSTAGAVTAHALRLGMAASQDPDGDAAELVARARGSAESLRAARRRILGPPGQVTLANLDALDPVRAIAIDRLHRALELVDELPGALAG